MYPCPVFGGVIDVDKLSSSWRNLSGRHSISLNVSPHFFLFLQAPSDLTPSSFLEKLIRSFLLCLATRIVFEARASCQTVILQAEV